MVVGLERWEVLLLVVTELHLEVVFAGSLGFLVKLFYYYKPCIGYAF